MYSVNIWLMLPSILLVVILIPGGFFMFRSFLRKMKNEENQQ